MWKVYICIVVFFFLCENSDCLGVRMCICYVMKMIVVMLLMGIGINVRENWDFVWLFRKSMFWFKMKRDKVFYFVSIFRVLGVVI